MLQPEEVVEVFLGDTLEEAMAYAVAALGPDLSVRRARKVRKGLQGLAGKDKYEVVALPAPSSGPDDALESAFDALLSQAEAAEAPRPRVSPEEPRRRTTRPHPSPSVADHSELFEPVAVRPPARKSRTATAAAAKATRKKATSTGSELAVPATRTPARRKPAAAPTGWSYDALVELGLPAVVLNALPAEDPADDLAWVVALAVALSAVLPAPGALGEDNPLVVNGYGMAGVLGLLDAATRGLTPGTITVGDRTAAATATELALAVRTAVVG